LSGFSFYGYHGARAEEKTLGQRFAVDVELWLDLQPAGESDDLTSTVDYSRAYRVIKQVLEGDSHDLLEAVAEHTARELLGQFEPLRAVVVRVHKPGAPLAGSQTGSVMVEVARRR
jgi:dihydroneopterin aldolase